ncbi:MAG: penicillin-binding protein 2 [Paenibacillaceae bacterium]|nr:penicillin-binding protein 2 [Paenibacillaceae bacterium]
MKQPVGMDDREKQERAARRHFSVRINMFFFCTFVLFSVLIVQLAILQFVQGKDLSASKNRTYKKDVTISPIRGNIYSQDGYPIAYTISTQSAYYLIEPDQKKADQIELAKKLESIFATYGNPDGTKLLAADIIKNMDVGFDINGNKAKDPSYTYWPRRIKSGLTNKEIAYISEHIDELPGIEVTEESTRQYDPSLIAPQLVGYLKQYSAAKNMKDSYIKKYTDNPEDYLNEEYVGFDGLEFLYQDDLRGKNGSKTYSVNPSSEIISQVSIVPPEKGRNLHLTLNKDVQLATQKAIEDHIKFMRTRTSSSDLYSMGNQAVAGYAVMMEVDTGRVIAMANYPSYDPNEWIGGFSQERYNQVLNSISNGTIRDRQPNILDDKERIKHPSSVVPLGSTMKPLTVLVGLSEGLLTTTETYSDYGSFNFGKDNKSTIRNSDGQGWGGINAAGALWHSSNTFMAAMIGNRLYLNKTGGLDIWNSYMEKFGLGVVTGSNLPGEYAGTKEYLTMAKDSSPQAALVYASFGQAARYTTLQLAQYATMLANHGKRYRPIFVDEITTYDNQLVTKVEPEILNEVTFPAAYWKTLEEGMSKVGTQQFEDFPYPYMRKTGTSEQDLPGKRVNNAVFISYAPADKPRVAVAVVVPEGGFGSFGAAPIARKMYDAYDQAIGMYGTPKGTPQQ